MQFYLQLLLIFIRVGQNPIAHNAITCVVNDDNTYFVCRWTQDETVPIKATTLCM